MNYTYYVDFSTLDPDEIGKYFELLRDNNFLVLREFDDSGKMIGVKVVTSKTLTEFTNSAFFPKGCDCRPYLE